MANPTPKQVVVPLTAQQYEKRVTPACQRDKTPEQVVQQLVDEA